jgi:hypothetical protein
MKLSQQDRGSGTGKPRHKNVAAPIFGRVREIAVAFDFVEGRGGRR